MEPVGEIVIFLFHNNSVQSEFHIVAFSCCLFLIPVAFAVISNIIVENTKFLLAESLGQDLTRWAIYSL